MRNNKQMFKTFRYDLGKLQYCKVCVLECAMLGHWKILFRVKPHSLRSHLKIK